jgi:phosphoglycolate phosphatase-like HAD superfamily hydrolase
MRLILVDIDHTLSDAAWRDHMMEACYRDKNWDEYHAASADDKPVPEMVAMINSLQKSGWYVTALTTRPEKWRVLTNAWLLKHGVLIDDLLMRPDGDYLPNNESKLAVFKKYVSQNGIRFENIIVIDDHERIVSIFKAEKITVLQTHVRRC